MKTLLKKSFFLTLILFLSGCGTTFQSPSSNYQILDEGVIDYVCWSPDGSKIAYVKDPFSEIWVLDIKSQKKERLNLNHVSIYNLAWFDSNKILFFHSDDHKKYATIYGTISMIDLVTNKQSDIASDVIVNYLTCFSHNAYFEMNKEVVRLNLNNGSKEMSTLNIPRQIGEYFKVSPIGDKIAFIDKPVEDKEPLKVRASLYEFDIKSGQVTRIDKLKSYEIDRYAWSPNGDSMVFYGRSPSDEKAKLYIASLTGSSEPKVILSNLGIAEVDWSSQNNQLALETVGQPGKNALLLFKIPDSVLHSIK